jgi:ubiquinone/menaquinone biosynthesis C-methylase UbiE
MTTQEIDQAKAQAFGGQMLSAMNGGALTLLVSVGHQTGLFETMAKLPPSTSQEIASAAGLNERYVREWLGGLTTSHVVEYDAATGKYTLPPEHAMSLTAAAGPNNLARMAQMLPMFSLVEDGIVNSFKNGGGVPYSEFPKFQGMMAQLSGEVFDAALVPVVLELVPGLTDRLRSGISALDVACGYGHASNVMARSFPNSSFTGYDFSEEGVEAATAESKAIGLTNTRFGVKDAASLDGSEKFDLLTVFDGIHDQAQPRKVLKGIHDSLKPDGVFLCADVAASSNLQDNLEHPMGTMMYMCSTFHCMTVSLALGGEGLGTMWGTQKALELFAEAGFSNVEVKSVEGDFMNAYYIAHP